MIHFASFFCEKTAGEAIAQSARKQEGNGTCEKLRSQIKNAKAYHVFKNMFATIKMQKHMIVIICIGTMHRLTISTAHNAAATLDQ